MSDLSEQLDIGGAFQRARAAVKDEMGDVTKDARDEMLRVIDLRDAKATGDLESAIQAHVKDLTGGVQGIAGADAKPGSNIAPYAPFVDQPTRPHFPPIKPLERWARSKFGATGKEKTSTAWAVARSIARRGTPGVRFTDAAARELRGTLGDRFEQAISDDLFAGE